MSSAVPLWYLRAAARFRHWTPETRAVADVLAVDYWAGGTPAPVLASPARIAHRTGRNVRHARRAVLVLSTPENALAELDRPAFGLGVLTRVAIGPNRCRLVAIAPWRSWAWGGADRAALATVIEPRPAGLAYELAAAFVGAVRTWAAAPPADPCDPVFRAWAEDLEDLGTRGYAPSDVAAAATVAGTDPILRRVVTTPRALLANWDGLYLRARRCAS